ncbi:hypothetical protein [Spiroplasma alleghenense]|uniref:Lipoprotein n=1 Tax=Spiroplasma alleghenense TaxID=216931 RepID=A0A345Z573_9MOLU|nr:hypothetical protein [Spiroplasma alleghenense]AXK51752.1 hypothetical protein SALLE_v1c10820 [Spiroplasma alleghenense]
MKKLLTILAASTMVISAPLSVVACKKTKTDIDNEFDYQALQQELRNSVQQIFDSNLKSDFDDYFFVDKKGGANGVEYPFGEKNDIEWFRSNQEEISKLNSPESKEVQESINKIINWNKVEDEINSLILTNINYKPILVSGKSPLKDGYYIQSLEVEEDLENKDIKVIISIGANFYYLNERQETQNDTLNNFKTSITILKELSADDLNKVKKDYQNALNTKENANSFVYKSDKGNLENNAQSINDKEEGKEIYSQIELILDTIDTNNGKIKFNNDFLINTNRDDIIKGSVSQTSSNWYWENGNFGNNEPSQTLKLALDGDAKAEDKFIKECSKNGSTWLRNSVKMHVKNIEELSAQYNDFAEVFNSFNLNSNLENTTFKKSLKNSNFKLELEDESDERNYIALFRANIEGIYFEYSGKKYELPTEQIVIKQLPFTNTIELYKKFIQNSFNFQKQMLGFNDDLIQENNPNYFFYLNKPNAWKTIEPTTPISATEGLEQLLEANPEATKYLVESDSSIDVFKYPSWDNGKSRWISFNENNDLYFYNSLLDTNYFFYLNTLFFSSGKMDKNDTLNFSLTFRTDFRILKVNESVSAWKLKD